MGNLTKKPANPRRRPQQEGMTLLEMMIGLGVASIVILIMSGSFVSVKQFAARFISRGESERAAAEIIQLVRTRIVTRDTDGLQLTDQSGLDFRHIEVDRTVNGKIQEMLVSMSCAAGPKGVTVPAVCGMSCLTGQRPVTTITIEKLGEPKVTRTYPAAATNPTAWIGNDALGVALCARQTLDAVSLRATVFFLSGKKVRHVARQANLPLSHFVMEEATLVP